MHGKLTGILAEQKDEIKTSEFNFLATMFGCKFKLGASFEEDGTVFTVAELKRSAKKYPVICKASNGSMYKFPVDKVNRLTA